MSENPYAVPQSNLTLGSKEEDYGEIRFFSSKGRIGRLRYISYTSTLILFGLIMGLVLVIFIGKGGPFSRLANIEELFIFLPLLFFVLFSFFALTIQRLHDANRSGWLAILLLIPLLNVMIVLALVGIPGTEGHNDFGAPPPPNTLLVRVSSVLFILFWILGQASRFLEKQL